MKKCVKCGKELADTAKFCAGCGTPQPEIAEAVNAAVTETVSEAEATVAPVVTEAANTVANTGAQIVPPTPKAPKAPKSGKSKKPLIFGIIGAVVAVAVIAFVLLWFLVINKYETIDAKDLVNVVCYGPNGHATAFVTIASEEALDEAMSNSDFMTAVYYDMDQKAAAAKENGEEYEANLSNWVKEATSGYLSTENKYRKKAFTTLTDLGAIKTAQKKLGSISVKVEEKELTDLSVGDKIHITVKYNEDKLKDGKVKIVNEEFDVTVTESMVAELTKLDPFKGFEPSVTGYAGYPTFNVDYNTIDSTAREYFYYNYNYEEWSTAKNNGDSITFTAECYRDLSNGYFKGNDGKFYEVKDSDLTYKFKLSGLKELTTLDVFKDLEFTVTGASPRLTVNISNENADETVRSYVYYDVTYPEDKYNGRLAIGDTVTITAYTYYETTLAEKGYTLPEELTYTYTIPAEGVAYYLDNASQLPALDADTLTDIETRKTESIDSNYLMNYYAGGTVTEITSCEKTGIFFANKEDSYENYLVIVYKVNATITSYSGDASAVETYIGFYNSDLMMDAEGNLQFGKESFDRCGSFESLEALAEDNYGFTYYDITFEEVK